MIALTIFLREAGREVWKIPKISFGLQREPSEGNFWPWAAIDADSKLVFSHRIGKRDWITSNMFVQDVRNRVSEVTRFVWYAKLHSLDEQPRQARTPCRR